MYEPVDKGGWWVVESSDAKSFVASKIFLINEENVLSAENHFGNSKIHFS